MTIRSLIVVTVFCSFAFSLHLTCGGGPVMPRPISVKGEILSLAGLEKLRLRIEFNSNLLDKLGFSVPTTERRLATMLGESGIDVVDDETSPTLRVRVLVQDHPKHPGILNATYHVTVEQDARIVRLGKVHRVPTYSFVHGDISTPAELIADVDRILVRIIHKVTQRVETANAASAASR
ncbi:MAG: hypothetical protein CMJ18_05100 [Phycisphaeraceae bacterium]|nr:hypothetical protein [Phycisphaeraceae bacterium]